MNGTPAWVAAEKHARAMAAERERQMLTAQAVREHLENVAAESRRFQAAIDHINSVCDSRTQ